jgi:spermidine synthase/MFS family permease
MTSAGAPRRGHEGPGALPPVAWGVFQVVFLCSGFAALLYQMIWQRLLTLFGGADVYSVTLIVSAFMAGLGLGSLAGGHVADRLNLRRRLYAFAVSEIAIAVFGAASVWILYDVLYARLGPVDLPAWATAAVLFGVLLWPTFFMGVSLPLLSRALSESTAMASRRIASLYGWNTVGAALGSLLTVWVILRAMDFRHATWIGAALNAGCAVAALWLARGVADGRRTDDGEPSPVEPAGPPVRHLGWWIALYALSGFIALSLEIVWFRLLGVILKSVSFTFATLLALFLAGVGAGSLLGHRLAERVPNPARAFFILQGAIPIYAALSLAAFLFAAPRFGLLRPVWEYMAGYESIDIAAAVRSAQRYALEAGDVAPQARRLSGLLVVLYGALPVFLVGPPTLMMGLSFALLQRAIQTDLGALGRRVGWLQAANIAGSTLGSILTGVWLLDAIGTAGTLQLLVALAGIFFAGAVGVASSTARRIAAVAAVLVINVALRLAPDSDKLWARLHGSRIEDIAFAEDGSGLSLIKHEGPISVVYVNGLGQSDLPYGGFHTVLGALPVLIHPRPEAVALIGLGSGETLFGAAGRAETAELYSIEIVEPQLETLETIRGQRAYPGLNLLLQDGRVRHAFTDGRAFILKGGRKFDVIEADALRPSSAYSGNLYSREYFELLRRHLKPGGLAVTWEPTRRTRTTLLSVFPHVLAFRALLIGSDTPIPWDPEVVRARMRDTFTDSFYRRGHVDIAALLEDVLSRPPTVYGPSDPRPMEDVNLDLFPRDEYLVGASFRPSHGAGGP